MKKFSHINVGSFEEASGALESYEKAQPVAGGTDLIGTLKQNLLPDYPELLVNLKEIPDVGYIRDNGDTVSIGALTKLYDTEESGLPTGELNTVWEAARSIAPPIVRNAATMGGNLCQDVRCWYYRYPDNIGGRLMCARKDGEECYAIHGRNQYHSVMGGTKVGITSCSAERPAGTDIPAYMQKIREDNWGGAAEIITQVNPTPMLTARACPHTCQAKCNQCQHGDSVSIHSVERVLGGYTLEHASRSYPAPSRETGKKVGIVGVGPAGSTAAYYLHKTGYQVTVYEKMEEAGGVLMYGIPEYYLPKHYVRNLVAAITGVGVRSKYNTEVGEDIAMETIEQDHDTVFLGTGAWKQPIPGIEGEQLTHFDLNLLVEVKKSMSRQIGREVLICGGGNVAMDVALTAVRLGTQKVKLVCLEQREEMPATEEEIARAEGEGVEVYSDWGLERVVESGDGQVAGLKAKKCVSVLDEHGHFNPVYDDAHKQMFASDCIILATGQRVDLDSLGEKYREELRDARGLIEVGEHKGTRAPGVYASGDAASGPSVAIKAVRDGGVAARSMSSYMGSSLQSKKKGERFLRHDSLAIEIPEAAVEEDTPVNERCLEKEDPGSLAQEGIKAEAGRCMSCGCYPVNVSDMSPMLIALGAKIHTTRQVFEVEDFFGVMYAADKLKPGEIIIETTIPKQEGWRTGYLKMRLRESIDFAVTSLAYAYKEEDGVIRGAHLAAGGTAPVPVHLFKVEELLVGRAVTEELAEEVAQLTYAGAAPLKENAYKLQEIEVQIKGSLGL